MKPASAAYMGSLSVWCNLSRPIDYTKGLACYKSYFKARQVWPVLFLDHFMIDLLMHFLAQYDFYSWIGVYLFQGRSDGVARASRPWGSLPGTSASLGCTEPMAHSHSVFELRRLQHEAEKMARLSPFPADRSRFNRIAKGYSEEADALDPASKAKPGETLG